ncbi:hypothetical protein LV156_009038 [Aspergillus fumigatus]|nr:hypothetical protein LV156_009038 [Aspergillus fumigatus]KAJ8227600.1 hypothetical protein LV160_009046 [Aspergillus fumigatus]
MMSRTGTTEASIYVSQSLLAGGNKKSSLEDVFCFGFLFRIGSVMPFDLEMGTRRSGVKRARMRGFKKTAQMFLYRSYTAFLHLLVKLLLDWKTYHCSPAAFNTYVVDFYHGLVVLSLHNIIPLPKIGSFVIDQNGFLRLTNRPLSLEIQDLENEEIPTNIPRDNTYSTVDSYVSDILRIHDSRLRHQPNAINDTGDYIYQTSALAAMRTVFPSFFNPELRRGPFAFTFTDFHQSNIFVDKDWHITYLVDLEWACTRPIEMLRTPTWLTNKAVDEIAEEPEEYDMMRREFMDILVAEERRLDRTASNHGSPQLSSIMEENWRVGTFWYTLALASPTGLFTVFYKQIQPRFIENCPEHDTFQQIMPWYWAQDWVKVAARKLLDRKEYDIRLQQAFEGSTTTQ